MTPPRRDDGGGRPHEHARPLRSRKDRRGFGAALAAARPPPPDLRASLFFRQDPSTGCLLPAPEQSLPLDLLFGVDAQKRRVVDAVARFERGHGVNHILLWGARGVGKSSLIKAAVAAAAAAAPALRLVEIDRTRLTALPLLFSQLRTLEARVVVYCDDLSFDSASGSGDAQSLKSALEGGVAGPPPNVMMAATSNRRHLQSRLEASGDRLAAAEDAEEMVSLSDRFGLWVGFAPFSQDDYLAAVCAYAERFKLAGPDLERSALQWAQLRGGRSGRAAVQFIRERAGAVGRPFPY